MPATEQIVSVSHNRNFFNGIYQEVWRRMIPPGLSEVEADFIADVCGLQQGRPVLDLMCGYGRHSLELASRGFPVTAIDSSEGYVSELKAAAAARGLPIDARQGDASATAFQGPYQAAICMGNSFAFFDEASVKQLLANLYVALEPDARFVINTWMIGEIAYRHFQEKVWHQVDEFKYLIESRFLRQPARIEAEHTIISPEGRVESIMGVDYIFTLPELERLFGEHGFVLTAVYYTPKKRPFRLGDNKAYLVCTRK